MVLERDVDFEDKSGGLPGTKGLMHAVLHTALEEYLFYSQITDRNAGRLTTEIRSWFSSDNNKYLFSFEKICEELDMDADTIRRRLNGIKRFN